jgi:hypothetical protein
MLFCGELIKIFCSTFFYLYRTLRAFCQTILITLRNFLTVILNLLPGLAESVYCLYHPSVAANVLRPGTAAPMCTIQYRKAFDPEIPSHRTFGT